MIGLHQIIIFSNGAFMIPKSLHNIVESDLQQLIQDQIPESKSIEYKRDLPGTSDTDKIKFLRALSSFANTNTGDLIYGVDAANGIPTHLIGITSVSSDEAILRLSSMCRDGIQPRISRINFIPVNLNAGGWVLVVRIDKSWSSPHRVTHSGHGHFYGRNSAGAYQLDVGELRAAFTFGDNIAERIKGFRASRLISINSGDTPVKLSTETGKIVLHLVPLSAFASYELLDFNSQPPNSNNLTPMFASSYSSKINLEGVLTYDYPQPSVSTYYVQAYRSGIIEAVSEFRITNGAKVIYGVYEERVIKSLKRYFEHLKAYEVNPPIFIFMSFLNIEGYRFDAGTFMADAATTPNLLYPDATINSYDESPDVIMKPIFESVCNSFGFVRPNF
jgi:hypothetical protein